MERKEEGWEGPKEWKGRRMSRTKGKEGKKDGKDQWKGREEG